MSYHVEPNEQNEQNEQNGSAMAVVEVVQRHAPKKRVQQEVQEKRANRFKNVQ